MGLFDDSAKLFNRSFPWGLGRYRADIDSELDSEAPPPDLDSISVYVDDEGKVNFDKQLLSYETKDPIDVPTEHSYSPDNNFIAQLNRTLTTVPIGGIILYPTYNTGSASASRRRYWFAGMAPRYQGRVRYPNDTPPGFVPCIGQVLKYPDGSAFQVTDLAPPVTSWGQWTGGRLGGGWGAGEGGYAPTWDYLPAVRYLQRVPEGWNVDPVVDGRGSVYLDEAKPDTVWSWWWGNGD